MEVDTQAYEDDQTQKIIGVIMTELKRAKQKFPWFPEDPVHAAAIVNEEAGELTRASLRITYEDAEWSEAVEEAIQTAAMSVRFLENLPRMQKRESRQLLT